MGSKTPQRGPSGSISATRSKIRRRSRSREIRPQTGRKNSTLKRYSPLRRRSRRSSLSPVDKREIKRSFLPRSSASERTNFRDSPSPQGFIVKNEKYDDKPNVDRVLNGRTEKKRQTHINLDKISFKLQIKRPETALDESIIIPRRNGEGKKPIFDRLEIKEHTIQHDEEVLPTTNKYRIPIPSSVTNSPPKTSPPQSKDNILKRSNSRERLRSRSLTSRSSRSIKSSKDENNNLNNEKRESCKSNSDRENRTPFEERQINTRSSEDENSTNRREDDRHRPGGQNHPERFYRNCHPQPWPRGRGYHVQPPGGYYVPTPTMRLPRPRFPILGPPPPQRWMGPPMYIPFRPRF